MSAKKTASPAAPSGFAAKPSRTQRGSRQSLLAVQLPPTTSPRNHVVRAFLVRAASGAAGKHVRSRGAERRADKMELRKQMTQTPCRDSREA